MLIFRSDTLTLSGAEGPSTPLNAVWISSLISKTDLPGIGHMYIVFPHGDAIVQCSEMTIPRGHYLWLTRAPGDAPFTLQMISGGPAHPAVMVFLISPAFIEEMADFLDIPPQLGDLLHGVPLRQGDKISQVLQRLSVTAQDEGRDAASEELFLEAAGQVLHLMRLRHQALISLSGRKQSTITDLVPRLLEARHYLEAHAFEPIKTRDVAGYVGLSEYHFSRLFKTAFDVSAYQYLLRLRLEKARVRLETSDLTVTSIAMRVGYKSLSAFIHAFHRRFEMSPTEYRSRSRVKMN